MFSLRFICFLDLLIRVCSCVCVCAEEGVGGLLPWGAKKEAPAAVPVQLTETNLK